MEMAAERKERTYQLEFRMLYQKDTASTTVNHQTTRL